MVESVSTQRVSPKQTARLPRAAAQNFSLTPTSLTHRGSAALPSSRGTADAEGRLTREEVAIEVAQGTS